MRMEQSSRSKVDFTLGLNSLGTGVTYGYSRATEGEPQVGGVLQLTASSADTLRFRCQLFGPHAVNIGNSRTGQQSLTFLRPYKYK
jgi:hypothetical protein